MYICVRTHTKYAQMRTHAIVIFNLLLSHIHSLSLCHIHTITLTLPSPSQVQRTCEALRKYKFTGKCLMRLCKSMTTFIAYTLSLSLSLSLFQTHTHTHTLSSTLLCLSIPLLYITRINN